MNSSKLILGIFGAAFAAVTLFAVSFFVQMHREITTLRAQEATSRRRLAEAEAKLSAQQKYLDELRHDPALVERLIREKLGYTKSQEWIFRFEEERKP
ncbi:MAG TPA: septum formation initiator family protein [Lacunisphaera sp.]|nr:septum formation initiator family protein [Lacunisphaera sp.]HQY06090.1 septum formation initiator family protein [Lacunisphaera sp.]